MRTYSKRVLVPNNIYMCEFLQFPKMLIAISNINIASSI